MGVGTKEQVAAVRRLVREQVAAVEHLEADALRPTLKVLAAARAELREDLSRWVKSIDKPTDAFTAHRMRVMLRSLEATIETLGINVQAMIDHRAIKATALDRDMLSGLNKGRATTGVLAVKNLETEIARLGHIFGDSIVGPQIETTAILARGKSLLYKREVTSAARYGRDVADDLRFQLSIGVARGETFEQLVQRLRRLGGPTGPVAVRGIFGHPGAIVEDIPEGLFKRYEYFARRLVRTEMMNAYNTQHREGIRQLNEERDRGDPEWLRRSDAAADGRVCRDICRPLDGAIARVGGVFNPGGYDGPPYHSNCRCVELAWLATWPKIGEISSDWKGSAERSAPAL